MKHVLAVLIMGLMLVTVACQPVEMTARDTIAASKGFLDSQSAIHAECATTPTLAVCGLITKGNAAKHLAIDALEEYCAGPQFESGGACVSPKDKTQKNQLQGKLTSALTNLNQIITDIKALK